MPIVLLTNDLMVASRIEGAAARAGVPFQSAANADDALSRGAANGATLFLVDLSTAPMDITSIVGRAHSMTVPPPTIIGFGPHVHKERLAAARAAGCDEVLSRGQFFADLEAIVSRDSSGAGQGTAGGG